MMPRNNEGYNSKKSKLNQKTDDLYNFLPSYLINDMSLVTENESQPPVNHFIFDDAPEYENRDV
jgi:hypothetical protein